MSEAKDIPTAEHEKEPGKRPPWWKRLWRRRSQQRTRKRKPWTLREFWGKSVWDWLQLLGTLAIPVVVAVAAAWFSWQQSETQTQIEEQRAQDEALQSYLDQMSSLLLEKELRASEEDSEVRTLARARTLTVLGRLDPGRKGAVMQFLVEAELVQRVEGGRGPIITLTDADLSDAALSDADLSNADLSGVTLNRASLLDARGADLSDASLSGAYLTDARGADLSDAILIEAYLSYASLQEADLSHASLQEADLSYANLSNADLSHTYLGNADLSDANLSNADLSGAIGWTDEQLRQARSLEGTTMPNGQKHEDWLKSHEG